MKDDERDLVIGKLINISKFLFKTFFYSHEQNRIFTHNFFFKRVIGFHILFHAEYGWLHVGQQSLK
ncbi:Uncharacterised protein [Mycobacterium tuberculosis]|nr:Uncharacterised protein [Mycobacterium tuberculosis]